MCVIYTSKGVMKMLGCALSIKKNTVNANSGRVNRATINNAWLKTKLGKEIICVGFDVHI
jgi:hypothetical protein